MPIREAESALSQAGVEIGSHTRHHVDLAKIDEPTLLHDEVITASQDLEQAIGQKIRYFAFPFGQKCNLNPQVFESLKANGFAGACSAYGGLNAIGGDAFHLQRVHGDPMFPRLRNWLTYDPRLLALEPYQYANQPVAAAMPPTCPIEETVQ